MTAAFLAVWAKEFGTKIAGAIWASFVALVSSPAVWLAGACIFVGGFWIGHIQGAHFSRARVPATLIGVAPATQDTTAYEATAAAATAEAAQWKAEAATKQAEITRLTAELGVKSDALKAAQAKLAAKVPVPKKAAPAPAKAAWSPFERN